MVIVLNSVKKDKWNREIPVFQTKHQLETLVDELNAGRSHCPVGLNTLVVPRKMTLSRRAETVNEKQHPYVYLNCGHVQGHHDWGHNKDSKRKRCPVCLEVGIFNLVPECVLLIKPRVGVLFKQSDSTATLLTKIISMGP